MPSFRVFCNTFQLTPSRRATKLQKMVDLAVSISTHALTEGDYCLFHTNTHTMYFNSRPHGGRLATNVPSGYFLLFQLTPSRRATVFLSHWLFISLFQLTPSRRATRFPHTLFHIKQFQLTPSRRATYRSQSIAERRDISTHALTEGDPVAIASVRNISYFNSRPHGGRQTQGGNTEKSFCISTHALTEGDRVFYNTGSVLHDFNSRPHGGRLSFADSISPNRSFQLTPSRRATSSLHMYSASRRFQLTPSRRATSSQLVYQVSISISTHALTEGDIMASVVAYYI